MHLGEGLQFGLDLHPLVCISAPPMSVRLGCQSLGAITTVSIGQLCSYAARCACHRPRVATHCAFRRRRATSPTTSMASTSYTRAIGCTNHRARGDTAAACEFIRWLRSPRPRHHLSWRCPCHWCLLNLALLLEASATKASNGSTGGGGRGGGRECNGGGISLQRRAAVSTAPSWPPSPP